MKAVMSYEVVILAAGKGSRMFSGKPKVLHHLAGKSMLAHQLDMLADIDECICVHVVVGHGREHVITEIAQLNARKKINVVDQKKQLGTGHAAAQALPFCNSDSMVLVLAGDIPLIGIHIVRKLWEGALNNRLSLLQSTMDQPFGYGRLMHNQDGNIVKIIEEKDADEEQKKICQVYCGVLAAKASELLGWLERIECDNAQSEYYLTDIVSVAVSDSVAPASVSSDNVFDYFGVNSYSQLAQLERLWQEHQAHNLMAAGVSICDPKRFDLRGTLSHGCDVSIDVNVLLSGDVFLGDGVVIGSNCYLENCKIAAGSIISPFTHISHASIGSDCLIGPYARIRPGSVLDREVSIGNFVEIKQVQIEQGVKISHLSYIGDAEVGASSNLGAGTITCNYDGMSKHRTIVGKDVFVGSNTALVAPLTIGDEATIGAGSVITRNVEPKSLAISRSEQKQHANWRGK